MWRWRPFWPRSVQRGFTLVELLLAVLAGSIVLLSIGSMWWMAERYWLRGSAKLDLARDGSMAMDTIAREIRQGPLSGISTQSAKLTIGARYIQQSGADLQFYDGTATHTLIAGTVVTLSFTFPAIASTGDTLTDAVGVTLDLSDGTSTCSFTSTVRARN